MTRIVLLCAGRRGLHVLEHLQAIAPQAERVVFSFREEAHEPPFMEDIRAAVEADGGTFYEARFVGHERWRSFWADTPIDLMLCVGWRYMVPPEVYERMQIGAFVFHDSLLPTYRGFAPTVWAMINGEKETGATLFEIAPGVDEGAIVGQQAIAIGADETIADVMARVTEVYCDLLSEHLPALLRGEAALKPQDGTMASFTCRRLPEDNVIDWRAPTATIYNLIRATTRPYPGAFTYLEGRKLTVWAARRLPELDARRYVGRVPGRVIEVRRGEGAVVLTGDSALLLTEAQIDDGERVNAAEILNSLSITLR